MAKSTITPAAPPADEAADALLACTIDGTGADGPRSEGGGRILLDNYRVYVRFLPFGSGRVHLGRLNIY